MNAILDKIKCFSNEYLSTSENNLDAFKESELLELKAEQLIVEYCESQNYLISGFPTEKRAIKDYLDEDYFSRERFRFYLDTLSIQKEDVAELMWQYASHFWPDYFKSKEEYLQCIKEQLECGVFYDVDDFN
jgi:hypothetical protein